MRNLNDTASVVSGKVERVKMLARWRPPYMSKAYRNVALLDRSPRVEYLGMTYVDHTAQHWVEKDGRWYIHFDWDER